MEDCN